MIGVTLGLAAALCFSLLDATRKAIVPYGTPLGFATALFVGQVPFLFVWALWDGTWVVGPTYWWPALLSLAMNALANVLFMVSVKLSPLSRTVPFLSLTPVFGGLLAVSMHHEFPSSLQWLGIFLVVAGAFVLNSDLSESLWRSLLAERGVPYMIAVALLWAAGTSLDKVALPHASPAAHSFIVSAGTAVILLVWVAVRGVPGELGLALRAPPPLLVAFIAFAVGALALQMLALESLWVAVVETLKRGVGVAGAVFLGRLLFREPITVAKLIALCFMVLGTLLLAQA